MKPSIRMLITLAALTTLLLGACTAEDDNDAPPPATPAASNAAAPADPAPAAGEQASETSELAGTSWSLVKIASMDDTELVPAEGSEFSLSFGEDGRASIVADCNRGTGEWRSEGPGQLQFGVIASTRALCPPESISERYLAQFEWIRTYVMRDGHLHLATMADGAIIEFAPK